MKNTYLLTLLLLFNLITFSQTNKIKKISVVDKDNNPVFRGFRSIRYMHQLKDNKSEFSEEDRLHYPYDYFISDESENNAVFYEVYKKDKKLNEVFFGYYQEYIKEGKDTIYYKIKLNIPQDEYYFRTPDPILFCNQINQKQYFHKTESAYNELKFGRIEREKYNNNVLVSKEEFNKTDSEHLIYKTLVNYTNGKEDNITYYFNVEGLDRVFMPNVKNVKIVNNKSVLPEGFNFYMYIKKGYLSEEVVNSDWFTKQSTTNIDGYIIKEWKNNEFQIKRVKYTPNPTITPSSSGFRICDIDWSFSGMVRSFREGVEWVNNNPIAKEFVTEKVNDLKEWWKSSPSSSNSSESYSNNSNKKNTNSDSENQTTKSDNVKHIEFIEDETRNCGNNVKITDYKVYKNGEKYSTISVSSFNGYWSTSCPNGGFLPDKAEQSRLTLKQFLIRQYESGTSNADSYTLTTK